MRVGQIAALWRYPVKSLLGERLQRLEIDGRGVVGDRGYALWDAAASKVASAKHPRKWARLLRFEARYRREPVSGQPLPPVTVEGPFREGDVSLESLSSEDPRLIESLSACFGRPLRLIDQPPEAASLEHYWPAVAGREFQDVTNDLTLPAGTFFDACPIHALSNATLEQFRQLEPQLDFAVERFRPNILIETDGPKVGFVEEAWVGGVLAMGEQVRLRVDRDCPRCVITTLAQGALPETMEILRATARHNHVVAGIRLSVLQSGRLAVGDPLHWWPS
ncbi:MAG: MOSC domain-containing protein [Cyanobacteriota bacterium]|nr:MOSC domain-containing protein [Cyanobacteriota bacterium]